MTSSFRHIVSCITVAIVVFFAASPMCAQHVYTVIVNDALVIRESPDLGAKKLGKLSPFELITSELSSEEFIQDQLRAQVVIGERKGFWLKVHSAKGNGYVFSSYVIPGDLSQNVDQSAPYSLLESGSLRNEFTYNPNLYYQLIPQSKLGGGIVQVHPKFQTNYDTEEFLTPDELGRCPSVNVALPGLSFGWNDLLIGMSCLLSDDELIDRALYTGNYLSDTAKTLQFALGGFDVSLLPDVVLNGDYVLHWVVKDSVRELIRYDLSEHLFPGVEHSFLVNFEQPKVQLIGLSCETNLPFLVVEANNLPEGCGVEWKHHLFQMQPDGKVHHEVLATNWACD